MDSDTFDVYDLHSFSQNGEGLRCTRIPYGISLTISGFDEYTTRLEYLIRPFAITGPDSLSRSSDYIQVTFIPRTAEGEWITCAVYRRDPSDNTWDYVGGAEGGKPNRGAIVVSPVDFLRSTSPGETIQVGLTRTLPMVRSSDFPSGSVGTYRTTRIHPVVIR